MVDGASSEARKRKMEQEVLLVQVRLGWYAKIEQRPGPQSLRSAPLPEHGQPAEISLESGARCEVNRDEPGWSSSPRSSKEGCTTVPPYQLIRSN